MFACLHITVRFLLCLVIEHKFLVGNGCFSNCFLPYLSFVVQGNRKAGYMKILCLLGKHSWKKGSWLEDCPETVSPLGAVTIKSFKFKQCGLACSRCEARKI